MDFTDLSNYFQSTPPDLVRPLLEKAELPWQVLDGLKKAIEVKVSGLPPSGRLIAKYSENPHPAGGIDHAYFITETQTLSEDFCDPKMNLFLSKGCLIEAGSTLKSHIYAEPDCEIRQGAYLRGNVFLGEKSVAGHTTEIKNSILMQHVEAGHFAYIGDSVIGAYVNLGAGTKISNLQFRTLAQKQAVSFTADPILFKVGGLTMETGMVKFGAMVGEGSEIGCNAVLSPMSFLMKESWVLPNLTLLKGAYPSNAKLKSLADCKRLLL